MGRSKNRGRHQVQAQRMPAGSPALPGAENVQQECLSARVPHLADSRAIPAENDQHESEQQQRIAVSSDVAESSDKAHELAHLVLQKDCQDLKEEATSWKTIANTLKVQRAKFKDERDAWQQTATSLAKERDDLKVLVAETVAHWAWHDEESDRWIPFSMDVNSQIERAYTEKKQSEDVKSGTNTYHVDLTSVPMTQTNVKSRRQRTLRRKVFDQDGSLPEKIKHVMSARMEQAEEISSLGARLTSMEKDLQRALLAETEAVKKEKATKDELQRYKAAADKATRLEQELKQAVASKNVAESRLKEQQQALTQAFANAEAYKQEISRLTTQLSKSRCDAQAAQQSKDELLSQSQCKCERLELALASSQDTVQKLRVDGEKYGEEFRKSIRQVDEVWKHRSGMVMVNEPPINFAAHRDLLRSRKFCHVQRSHQGALSRCFDFQGLIIHAIQTVHNPSLWRKYTVCQDDIRSAKQRGSDWKFLGGDLSKLLGEVILDLSLNEFVLLHGCSQEAAQKIINQGFDIRYTSTHGGSMYGEGIYFSHQGCKCNQYAVPSSTASNLRYMIVALVTLGNPSFVRGPHSGRFPPPHPIPGCHFDSVVVDPDKSLSTPRQCHWEYVIFKGEQAYPAMLITYEVPGP